MEKISHRITLDVHKGGIQKVLHGMFTGDVLSRKIVISLVAGSAVCTMDENTAAVMYVTKPSGVTNYGACTVEDNLVTYVILPADIDEPGITQMQLKVFSGEMVLYAPMFSLEVQKSSVSDTPAETSPQFSALEQALAQVEEVYNKRISSIEILEDYTFVITYADGETYTSEAFKALMEEIDKAEHERAEAEAGRDVAEENRVLAESARASSYADMQNDIQSAINANAALYNRVEELADEGLITESRVIEIIEEQGGGGGGGTVVLPDNVLVASDVTAADVEAPKINADLFGSLLPSDYAKTSDVSNIINGTTQVGNAATLDGHGAEYFATADSINNIIDGTTPVGKANQLSTARNINGVAFDGSKDVTVYDTRFITEDGAIVSSSPIKASVIESTGKLISNILTSSITQGGIVELSKPKDYLDADVNIDINGNNVRFFENGGGYRGASIDLTKCSSVSDTELLHTGNKPSGTYMGNGSSSYRVVEVGGIGDAVLVWSIEPLTVALLTRGGAFEGNASGIFKHTTNIGMLPTGNSIGVADSDNIINQNGVVYSYRVL